MATTRLSEKALFVQRGYGQVEPNHLSGPRDGRVYAQLPANADIKVLENGQFAKYDYAKGEVNFDGEGEWMLVLNEIKIYRDFETDADFAMKKSAYNARVYSPGGQGASKVVIDAKGEYTFYGTEESAQLRTDGSSEPTMMPEGSTMVPRLIGTVVGDLFTTNTIAETSLAVGDILAPNADGYLSKSGDTTAMKWKVVKVYTMPDNQPGVKVQRVA